MDTTEALPETIYVCESCDIIWYGVDEADTDGPEPECHICGEPDRWVKYVKATTKDDTN